MRPTLADGATLNGKSKLDTCCTGADDSQVKGTMVRSDAGSELWQGRHKRLDGSDWDDISCGSD
ncbi:hypothetical protein NLR03_23930, partial [Escherichia coli]|nr:hypothetical protein [Escherichia coli]